MIIAAIAMLELEAIEDEKSEVESSMHEQEAKGSHCDNKVGPFRGVACIGLKDQGAHLHQAKQSDGIRDD